MKNVQRVETAPQPVEKIPLILEGGEVVKQVNSIYLKISPRHPYKNKKNNNTWWHVTYVPLNALAAFPNGSYQVKKGIANGKAVFYLELRPDTF